MSYTLAAAARATGLGKCTIVKAIRCGRLPARKPSMASGTANRRVSPHMSPRLESSAAAVCGAAIRLADVADLVMQIEALIRRAAPF